MSSNFRFFRFEGKHEKLINFDKANLKAQKATQNMRTIHVREPRVVTASHRFLFHSRQISFLLSFIAWSKLTNFLIYVYVVVIILGNWSHIRCIVGLLWWCKGRWQVSCKKKWICLQLCSLMTHIFLLFSPDACCCCAGGWRCRNGWLKKTSNGIRSLALRRSKPKRRSCSSGVVPTGTLKQYSTTSVTAVKRFKKKLTLVPNLRSSRRSFSALAVCELGMELFPLNIETQSFQATRDLKAKQTWG